MSRSLGVGLALALVSALSFGASGALAKGLLEAGWTPAAAVTWRVCLGALVLLAPAVLAMRGKWDRLRHGWPHVVAFGVVAVALCQLAYFLAVQRLSVGVALLLEYLGIVLVVGWLWLRHGERPRPLTVLGAALAVAGLLFVLDVFGGTRIDALGAFWGLVAAAGLACFFVLSADARHGLPPLAMSTGGLAVGAVVLVLAGLLGVVPMRVSTSEVLLAGAPVPWWVPALGLGVGSAALAYTSGVMAARRLGSKLASFAGLTEILFAVVWAWLLLGELPALVQLAGGLLIVAGVVAVRADERPGRGLGPAPRPTAPDSQRPAVTVDVP